MNTQTGNGLAHGTTLRTLKGQGEGAPAALLAQAAMDPLAVPQTHGGTAIAVCPEENFARWASCHHYWGRSSSVRE